jgi:predicted RNA polymerase sigma factor
LSFPAGGGRTDAAGGAEAAARRSYGKLVAILSARTRDVAAAEDALSEAFAAALDGWPRQGVPGNPEAWLLTVARRRLVDAVRARVQDEAASAHLLLLEELAEPAAGLAALDALAGDARLADYQPWWAARADLLARCGQRAQALAAYQRAIGLESDAAVRRFLQGRALAR